MSRARSIKIIRLFALVCGIICTQVLASAQVNNPSITYILTSASLPVSCTGYQTWEVVGNPTLLGTIYTCQGGTPTALSGGSGGAVNSVANSDGTLTVSPTTGSVVASLALGHANTWTTAQTFPNVILSGTPASSSTTGLLSIGTLGFGAAYPAFTAQYSVNNYFQNVIQNTSNGTAASSDYIAENNNGTDSTFYEDCGINSSGFTPAGNLTGLANESYCYGASGDFGIGTLTANSIHIVTDNSTVDAINIASGGASAAGITTINAPPILTGLTGYLYANNTSAVTASTTIPIANLATIAANTTLANVTTSTAAATAAAIPSGFQFYTAGTGYSTATAAQLGTTINIAANAVIKSAGTTSAPVASSMTDNGTTVTSTDTGGYVAPVFVANGTTAGFVDLPQGTTSGSVAPCNTATSICIQAPTSVTSQLRVLAGTPATGTPFYTNSSGTMTETINPGFSTAANCSSSASPAVCGSASAGSVLIPTGTTSSTLVVNTTAVTANSQIFFYPDDTLGTKLSTTCNSTLATLIGGSAITARTAGTSFTITFNGTIVTNGVCGSFMVVN